MSERAWVRLGRVLVCLGCVRVSERVWVCLGRVWVCLGRLWVCLGVSGARLGVSRGAPGQQKTRIVPLRAIWHLKLASARLDSVGVLMKCLGGVVTG